MVRPAKFQYNIETAASNDYQKNITSITPQYINAQAQAEHDRFVQTLRDHGVDVLVVQDTEDPVKPDAIFPNNWISMHADGRLVLYPMKNENRARERRADIVQMIRDCFEVKDVLDWSFYEKEGLALEGTGSIVFDHIHRVAYACLSPRTDKNLFENFCKVIGYKPVVFYAYDHGGKLIYHTNVVMCVGEGFVVIGMCSVKDEKEKQMLLDQFKESNLEVIDLTFTQLNENFAGNMLQVHNKQGEKYLVMSERAFKSLRPDQIDILQKHTKLLPIPVYMIEDIGGGSARCMMAEIFCKAK